MAEPRKRSSCVRWGALLSVFGLLACVGVFLLLRQLFPGLPGLPDLPGLPWKGPAVTIPVDTGSTTTSSSGIEPLPAGGELTIRLSEGQAQPQGFQPLPQATGVPLSPEEVAQILARVPALTAEPADQVDFRLAQEPVPPPLTGETITESFPPAGPTVTSPPPGTQVTQTAPTGPLEVLRYAPEGEIPIAPFVQVTFNQPMMPLATVEDLAAKDVPVKLEPDLPGTWRWLGVKTLIFEYESDLIDRLPKSTEYRVTVPAGTKSVLGGELAQAVTWTFTMPTARLIASYPTGPSQPLEPIFYVAFDQRVDPAAVLKTIRAYAGSNALELVLASQADVEKDKQVSQMVKYAQEGRWLAFKSVEPLPTDTTINVTIGPGTPSAEGPLLTPDAQSYSFTTYAPLRIDDYGCSWYDNVCRPLTPFYIRFNNSLDTQAYTATLLTVQPEIPGANVNLYGNSIEIKGATKGQTTYTVIVDGDIQDVYGQKLGKDSRLTFKVGQAEPLLVGPNQPFITIDPQAKKPVFSVYTINYARLDVKIYAVQPSDWPGFKRYVREWQSSDTLPVMPGRLVFDDAIRPEAATDVLTQVDIDLSKYLDGPYGQFVVVVAPPQGLLQDKNEIFWRTILAWVQVTQIGLDAFNDPTEMVAWTTSLQDGAPLEGVTILAENGTEQAVTGADGIARFPIPSGATYLVARKGADQALLPRSNNTWGDDAWWVSSSLDNLRWYVFDDRQMYKPGEELHLKGWMRRVGSKQEGDVGLVSAAGAGITSVNYQVTDPQGNNVGGGQAEVNALGGFDFVFTLPTVVNLGSATLTLTAQGDLSGLDSPQFYHYFQIQEFRRPEFEVKARNETTGPYFAGGNAVLAVEAKYYAGGPLPNAEVTWQVTSSPSSYAPPNWPDFVFGTWEPWWWSYERYDYRAYGGSGGGTTETFIGKTDASGTHYLRLDFDGSSGPRPVSVLASATVMDVNRQAWGSMTSLLVHPADLYIGLRSERYFVERGTPLKVDFIVTDLDGKPVEDRPVQVTAARLEWDYSGGGWSEKEVDVQTCSLGSKLEPVTCTFETPLGGTYRITALVTDQAGRKNQSQFTRWVSGGQQPPARSVEMEKVTLIPDKEFYQPGDVAEILVQSPFSPAEGLLTVSRSGLLYTERFAITDGTATLHVPIEEQYIPNLNIQVDLNGAAPRLSDEGQPLPDVPKRPAYATASLNLSIPPRSRTLSLEIEPAAKELEPGQETTVAVTVHDANGKPVEGAELAVVVVDEAVLALTNYQLADPISVFYSDRPSAWDSIYSRASIVLVDPQALASDATQNKVLQSVEVPRAAAEAAQQPAAGAMSMPMATATASLADGAATPTTPIQVRVDFNPLATFAPAVHTDAEGKASIPVKLPDNLTRYRIMVVAVEDGNRFGSGEANLTARLPLMVRPSAPRFLNFGDRFELPVVLQNQTDEPMEVSVIVQASNLELVNAGPDGTAGMRLTVPARDRVEVRFPASTQRAGTVHLQIAAVSGAYADAATVQLPVYTPATTEAFATYGVVDEGAVIQPVEAPTGVFPQYGGLEINTSSTALQALTDAVLYLVAYPFECSEQLSSRILAVAALRDVLTAFEADGLPTPAEMEAAVTRDLERLKGMQNDDGGFPYWRRGFDSIPFNTIHVTHALYRAEQKGFTVPEEMKQPALEYLRNIENHYPAWYGQQTRWSLSAYALYVRNLMGDRDPQKAKALIQEASLEKLSLEATGWLWPVLQDAPGTETQLEAIRQYVNNHVVETAGAANFTTYYDDQTYLLLSSDRRTDAILLDALIADNPQSDLIPKLVNGLLAHRTRGRWGNTQENVFVLLALDRYFNTFESQTPDFVARIWLGNTYAGSHTYQGRTTERHETLIPMTYLVDETLGGGQTQNLILSKEGTGRLYYRLGLSYAPTNLTLEPLDMGFAVQRVYEAIDDPADVSKDGNGIWHIKAGARVRVRITMVATDRRYHVALVDPLPAGLEIVNPTLAVSGSTPQDPGSSKYGWWWWGTWYEHQNLRDERAEAFTSLLWDGVYEYTYIARATTPGTFVVPPAKAEEMYSPEVFGRSASDQVIVEDASTQK